MQFSDTVSWSRGKHYLRFGGSVIHHRSGGTGSEPGTAILGTFTFKNTTTLPFGQLTLNDVQNYTQPIDFGINSYDLPQWLNTLFVQDNIKLDPTFTLDLGLRYDRQTLTDAKKNFAPRIGFGWHPGGDSRLSIRFGYAMYYTQIRANAVAGYLVNGLDGLTTYTATQGQTGFPTCLVGSCLPVAVDPKTIAASQLPARDITIRAGLRDLAGAGVADDDRVGAERARAANAVITLAPGAAAKRQRAHFDVASGLIEAGAAMIADGEIPRRVDATGMIED